MKSQSKVGAETMGHVVSPNIHGSLDFMNPKFNHKYGNIRFTKRSSVSVVELRSTNSLWLPLYKSRGCSSSFHKGSQRKESLYS
jgi:hypothetical protein